jgi:hypothetical protein
VSEKVSPRIKLFAIIAIGAVIALSLGLLVLGRSQPASEAAPIPLKPLVPKKAEPAPVAAKGKPAVKRVRPRPVVGPNGLPIAVEDALRKDEVVVVSLYSPDVAVDEMAAGEATAGAKAAGVGFVRVNVLNQREVKALALRAGAVRDPSVLVFRRPADLYVRIDGFVDRETVAQAAANAADATTAAQ